MTDDEQTHLHTYTLTHLHTTVDEQTLLHTYTLTHDGGYTLTHDG